MAIRKYIISIFAAFMKKENIRFLIFDIYLSEHQMHVSGKYSFASIHCLVKIDYLVDFFILKRGR